jgi:hypothetical protein
MRPTAYDKGYAATVSFNAGTVGFNAATASFEGLRHPPLLSLASSIGVCEPKKKDQPCMLEPKAMLLKRGRLVCVCV